MVMRLGVCTTTRWSELMGEPVTAPLMETVNLSKQFVLRNSRLRRIRGRPPELLHAVDNVSLSIERGETMALVGESGCGKSTLGRLLLNLETPTSGRLRYEGVDVDFRDSRSAARLRRKIQIIFQDPYSSL